MNDQTLLRFRQRLLKMNRSVHDDFEAIQETTMQPSGGQLGGETSNAPMHLGDRGTEEYLNQLSSTLLSNQETLLGQIEQALGRLDAGTFGVCESCGQPIALDRLDALPFAKECIGCASKAGAEQTPNLNDGRPHGPDDTLAPEGEMSESRRFGAFDGEPAVSSSGTRERSRHLADTHAVGTAGGGDALGGLAGSNVGRGEPQIADLEDAMGDGGYQNEEGQTFKRPRDSR